jgi:hypothetical protein
VFWGSEACRLFHRVPFEDPAQSEDFFCRLER